MVKCILTDFETRESSLVSQRKVKSLPYINDTHAFCMPCCLYASTPPGQSHVRIKSVTCFQVFSPEQIKQNTVFYSLNSSLSAGSPETSTDVGELQLLPYFLVLLFDESFTYA